MELIQLSVLDLALAALLVLSLAGLTLFSRLGLERGLLIAAARMVLQLLLVGLILQTLFDNAQLSWVIIMAMVMLLIAGYEVMSRQERRFVGLWGYGIGTATMFISSFTVTVLALTVMVSPAPWWQPQYAIPLLGMLLGNTMTGIALGLDRLTQTVWRERRVIEGRLALGESWVTATATMRREASRSGLMPTINAMAAAGIVSLPGMMTGQILAGVSPLDAVKYQILIMFLIAAGTGFGALTAVWFAARRLFDQRSRLRLDRLQSARR